jgi:hypothetical protein
VTSASTAIYTFQRSPAYTSHPLCHATVEGLTASPMAVSYTGWLASLSPSRRLPGTWITSTWQGTDAELLVLRLSFSRQHAHCPSRPFSAHADLGTSVLQGVINAAAIRDGSVMFPAGTLGREEILPALITPNRREPLYWATRERITRQAGKVIPALIARSTRRLPSL